MEQKDNFKSKVNGLDEESVKESRDGPSEDDAASTPVQDSADAQSVEALQSSLTSKAGEVQDLQDKYLRLAAEFENYKKLALRDQREHVRFANERLLKEFLPVIDNLQRAIHSAKENVAGDALIQGVELTLKQALEALAKFGLQPMDSVGKPFDPAWHQAVAKVEAVSQPENTVVEEFQRGYTLHDRVLRAAMVSVASPSASPDSGEAAAGRTADEAPSETSDETPR